MSTERETNRKIRLAIVGFGHVASYQIEAIRRIKEFQLIAVCDTDKTKKKDIPESVIFIDDYRDILSQTQIDVAVISVPNRLHYKIAKYFLEEETDVLLEKPATLSIDEFDNLLESARENNLVLVIAFHAAFARDLHHFLNLHEKGLLKINLGNLVGFKCSFYDPYISNEGLRKEAEGLIGSWIDSGINALSVLGKIPWISELRVEEALSSVIPFYKCQDIQSTVTFTFKSKYSNDIYRGIIDTNWSLNIDYKVTRLFFDNHTEVILNHSNQQIILKRGNGFLRIINGFSNDCPRLLNHYLGVFNDLSQHYLKRTDNLDHARWLHELLLEPPKLKNSPLYYHITK